MRGKPLIFDSCSWRIVSKQQCCLPGDRFETSGGVHVIIGDVFVSLEKHLEAVADGQISSTSFKATLQRSVGKLYM